MSAPARDGHRLAKDSLGVSQIIASTLANIAPAMSFFFGFGLIVSGAGVGAPLTILTAMVVILFLTNTLAEFSKYRPSTGSFVTFIGMSFGPFAGAAASIFVVVGYCIAASSVVVIAGGWAASTLHLFLGWNIPWQVLSIIVTGIVGLLVSRGISLSTTWAAIFFYFELILLLIGCFMETIAALLILIPILVPVAVDPVNEIMSTRGETVSSSPTRWSEEVTMLRTPGGMSVFSATSLARLA